MSITINIKSSGDNKYELVIDPSITILELKQEIATKADVTPDRQRLIYSGKVLKDGDTVESYKIQSGHTIHLVKSAAARATAGSGSGSDAGTTSTSPSAGATTGTNTDGAGVPSSIASGQGSFNPLADLTGARYAGYTQLPSASMFGPDGGMNSAMPDPEQLSQMMSSPMFQEQMNAMLSNPQMLDFLIQQNPQLRAMGPQVREMMQSPFVRQMMSNPEMMRGMMEMGRNQMGGAAGGFPAPGNPTGESTDDSTTTNTTSTPAANPFGNLFPGGVPPNPFSFGNPVPQDTPQDTRPPEERYETQLRQLNDMGFFEFDRNIEALRRTGGSVQGAIEYLLNN
jgi:ubiquilin